MPWPKTGATQNHAQLGLLNNQTVSSLNNDSLILIILLLHSATLVVQKREVFKGFYILINCAVIGYF